MVFIWKLNGLKAGYEAQGKIKYLYNMYWLAIKLWMFTPFQLGCMPGGFQKTLFTLQRWMIGMLRAVRSFTRGLGVWIQVLVLAKQVILLSFLSSLVFWVQLSHAHLNFMSLSLNI